MLRMAPKSRSGGTSHDIRRDLSTEQLAGIGAVAVAWNEIEFMLDVVLYSGEKRPASCLQDDLPRKRLDEKIRHAGTAIVRWGLSSEAMRCFENTAAAFSTFKELRNAVIHSRVFDSWNAIGHRFTPKGQLQEVLISAAALEWLYQQLLALCFELRCLLAVFDLVRTTEIAEKRGLIRPGQVDPIPEVRDWLARMDKTRSDRESLGPAPQFPN